MKTQIKIMQSLIQLKKFLISLVWFNFQKGYTVIYSWLNLLFYKIYTYNSCLNINFIPINFYIINYNYIYIKITKTNYYIYNFINVFRKPIIKIFRLGIYIIRYLIIKIYNINTIILKYYILKFLNNKNIILPAKLQKILIKSFITLLQISTLLIFLIFSEFYLIIFFKVIAFTFFYLFNFFSSIFFWFTDQCSTTNPLILAVLEFPEFFKSFLESRVLLKKILEDTITWNFFIDWLALFEYFCAYFFGIIAAPLNYMIWLAAFTENFGGSSILANINCDFSPGDILTNYLNFWFYCSPHLPMNWNLDPLYQILAGVLLSCQLISLNCGFNLSFFFELVLNVELNSSLTSIFCFNWFSLFQKELTALDFVVQSGAHLIYWFAHVTVNFLYFFSDFATNSLNIGAFLLLTEGYYFFSTSIFYILIEDWLFLLLVYTCVGVGAPLSPYLGAVLSALYYVTIQVYGLFSLLPYALIAQLYQCLLSLFAYTCYLFIVCLDNLQYQYVFLLSEIITFFFNFVFDLANIFTFTFISSILHFSESQVASFFAVMSTCFGNLAITLPTVFYAYYVAAAFFFSCGFAVVNRFFLVRAARSRAQLNLPPAVVVPQIGRSNARFLDIASSAGRVANVVGVKSFNLKTYSPYAANLPEQLIYQTKFFYAELIAAASQFHLLQVRDNFIRIEFSKIGVGFFLSLISFSRKQKEIFFVGFVRYYFALINSLMQFIGWGFSAPSKQHTLLLDNIGDKPGGGLLGVGPDFQHLYLVITLPLFFVTYLSDFFFWATGSSMSRFQQFSATPGSINLANATFNSRLLRELGASPFKFSDEHFSASELASKYFFFIDSRRPIFDVDGSETEEFPYFSSAIANVAGGFNDLEFQFLKHSTFNAIFAEHYYDYSSYYTGFFDMRYFNYAFSFINDFCRYNLGFSVPGTIKYLMFPPLLLNWIFSYPYIHWYGGFASDELVQRNAIDLLVTELHFLRFLVVNTFMDPTSLITIKPWRLTRGDLFTNPLFSWHWHYRRFNSWHFYFQRRPIRRLRGSFPREMLYSLNPYAIFEQLPDFVVTSPLFTDDSVFVKKFSLTSKGVERDVGISSFLVRSRTYNRVDFYRSPRRFIQYPVSRESSRYITPEVGYFRLNLVGAANDVISGNTYTLRRYNAFFTELEGFERKSRALGGVGVWSLAFTPNDYFFRWFYYKYWTAKQAYYSKFLFYEKFQFLKRRKFYISRFKFKHLLGWKRTVRLSHKSVWRFNNYKRERLTRRLATLFYLLRADFSDFWRESPLRVKSWFALSSDILVEHFFKLKYTDQSFYDIMYTVPVFAWIGAVAHDALRACLRQIHIIFSFFLHTNLAPHHIIPLELLKRLADKLTLTGVNVNSRSEFSLYILRANLLFYNTKISFLNKSQLFGPNSNYIVNFY